MVVRAYVFEIRGGQLIAEPEPLKISWSNTSNTPETVDITIDLNSPAEAARNWPNLGAAWKHGIAVDIEGRLLGGPIMPHDFDDDGSSLTLTARGIRVALARRHILPVDALTESLVTPAGVPDVTKDTLINGYDLGTIGKKITEQAFTWPGWTDIPISFHPDRAGSRFRSYSAVELETVDDALSDLSGVQNGPDFRFQLVWTSEDTIGWVFQSGTETQPRLQSADVFQWEVGEGSGLSVKTNPSLMGSVSWSVGGRSDDRTEIAMMYDPYLVEQGYPLLELQSDASANTSEVATLESWNVETLRTARRPWEFWSFKVRADLPPFPGEYNPGDLIDVIVTRDVPVSGGYVAPGTYRRRIAGMSGDEQGEWVEITCGEAYDGG